MAEAMLDWREFDKWRAPGFEARLFPEWYAARHRELLKLVEMSEGIPKKKALTGFFSQAVGQMNSVLWNPDLRIFGRPDSPNSEIQELVFSNNHRILSWPFDFPPKDYESRVLIEAGDEMREYYDVYVFPFLVAPRLAGRLSGFMDAALTDRLWADFELLRVQVGLADRVGALGDGQALVPISDRPKNMIAEIRGILDRLKLAPELVQRASDVIADRLSRLLSPVLSGSLALHGRDRAGRLRNVPVTSLREAGVSLCLSGAAIYRSAAIAWTDLRFGKLDETMPSPFDEVPRLSTAADGKLEAVAANLSSHGSSAVVYELPPTSGRPLSSTKAKILDALIAERFASDAPLYKNYRALAYELGRREICELRKLDPDDDANKKMEIGFQAQKNSENWLKNNFIQVRSILVIEGGEHED